MPDEPRQLSLDEYPRPLCEIPEPPTELWMRGKFATPGTKHLAVVGSRALTEYGRTACESLIRGLSGYPISIVSGLALGTDAVAHKAALEAGLHTVAIPGSGLGDKVIGPRANLPLAMDILAAGGALLSEHPPDYTPRPYDFPSRNRIMVGLSDAVLVIEAAEKSGTLITARLAAEYNRDLLCVPHRIKDPNGYGSHLFIRLGAALITEPAHILEALGLKEELATPAPENLSADEVRVYQLLERALPREELIKLSGLSSTDALYALVALELKGHAKEELGTWKRV